MGGNPGSGFDPLLLGKAKKIRLLALDVDGVMTDGKLYFDQAGNEMKSFSTRDGWGIKALQRFGIAVAILTGRQSAIVSHRARELGIELVYQGIQDKLAVFGKLMDRTGVGAEEVCFAGDDWPDIPVLARAGLAVTVPAADSQVKSRAHWITSRQGGDGAVREICDLILLAKGLDQVLIEEAGGA